MARALEPLTDVRVHSPINGFNTRGINELGCGTVLGTMRLVLGQPDTFSAADVYFGAGIRWTTLFGILPKRPEFTAYIARLEARPALQRANAKDAELAAAQTA